MLMLHSRQEAWRLRLDLDQEVLRSLLPQRQAHVCNPWWHQRALVQKWFSQCNALQAHPRHVTLLLDAQSLLSRSEKDMDALSWQQAQPKSKLEAWLTLV
mmetsp:Transcript_1561/g.2867  ORF Transcript_1561/g.2867 Transcript_1561/m.2867 type:complete len:100 (+) Transcript_1561:1060-1359(+)